MQINIDFPHWTPKHDKLHIWTFENAMTIRESLFGKLTKYKLAEHGFERPILTRHGREVGNVDVLLKLLVKNFDEAWFAENDYDYTCFEAKPVIPSIGDLVRQINKYRLYLPKHTKFVVVCPDNSHAQFLLSLGIYFFKSPPISSL
jgi:hypothetical protein